MMPACAPSQPGTRVAQTMIQPRPDFLESFDALEQSIHALPRQRTLWPTPIAPDPQTLEAWLTPYQHWRLPAVYLDYARRYGGVACNVPPRGVGLRPISRLLKYRRKREAVGQVFRTRIVPISPANIDGTLCLVFGDDDAAARVAFFHDDDDVVYEADSFALYLWNAMFAHCTIYGVRFSEYFAFEGIAAEDAGPFNLRLAAALGAAGFELLGADSRIVCGQRDATRFSITVRGDDIGVSVSNERSHSLLVRACADLATVLESNRCARDITS